MAEHKDTDESAPASCAIGRNHADRILRTWLKNHPECGESFLYLHIRKSKSAHDRPHPRHVFALLEPVKMGLDYVSVNAATGLVRLCS